MPSSSEKVKSSRRQGLLDEGQPILGWQHVRSRPSGRFLPGNGHVSSREMPKPCVAMMLERMCWLLLHIMAKRARVVRKAGKPVSFPFALRGLSASVLLTFGRPVLNCSNPVNRNQHTSI